MFDGAVARTKKDRTEDEKSFGIHVGAMAGLPKEVVDRAAQILKNLEANELDVNAPQKVVRRPRRKLSEMPGQMTFF